MRRSLAAVLSRVITLKLPKEYILDLQIDKTLVVDLDGTLLKSDMLYESFWSALSRNLLTPLFAALALWRGKAALKSYLISEANVAVHTLPYDQVIVEYIRSFRQQGGRTALVTASNQIAANQIAQHLQIFDEVHGSSTTQNLIGANKAKFLLERFGRDNFQYMGDANADLHVWEVSEKIVTVNASSSLKRKTERLQKPTEHIATANKSGAAYIKALRPHQWLKNILVFLPILAAHQLDATSVLNSLACFIAISLIASSVYVLNDLLDLNADRAHPRKCLRPFASGAVPISHGTFLAITTLVLGFLISGVIGWKLIAALSGYYILTTAYSLHLKRKAILDICVLAGLYTFRIVGGSVATGINISVWLFAFSIFFFFALAAVKRQIELVDMAGRDKEVAIGRGYHINDLPIITSIGLASGYISVLILALYINSPDVITLYSSPEVLWGICCILLYWLTRTVLIAHRGMMNDDPIVFAATDRVSQFCFIAMLTFAIIGAFL